MKMIIGLTLAALLSAAIPASALAQGKSAEAPGQDRTCLVESRTGGWNDADVASAKWLPRKAAEAQASKDPSKFRVYDYADDPLVADRTYASAEELCNEHFNQ